jgi:hypothetical protein
MDNAFGTPNDLELVIDDVAFVRWSHGRMRGWDGARLERTLREPAVAAKYKSDPGISLDEFFADIHDSVLLTGHPGVCTCYPCPVPPCYPCRVSRPL